MYHVTPLLLIVQYNKYYQNIKSFNLKFGLVFQSDLEEFFNSSVDDSYKLMHKCTGEEIWGISYMQLRWLLLNIF